ncbi:hypothetical protein EHM69_02630 [candidate division KSB1 bacterium]|nr:MAG: hypothetical protein EHM69_02630 [candidate division KSB1 bacterium]
MTDSPQSLRFAFHSGYFWPATAALWTAAVFALALSPGADKSWLMKTFGDKILHGAAFSIGALVWVKTIHVLPRFSLGSAMAFGSTASLIVGAAIELLQRYIPGRKCDIRDFASDLIGVLLALLLLAVFRSPKSRRNTSVPVSSMFDRPST